VAQAFSQKPVVDFAENFAHVVDDHGSMPIAVLVLPLLFFKTFVGIKWIHFY
jgi:hypothetical protein